MRGTHSSRHVDRRCDGIIPALAGNTSAARTSRRARWDHPRACGEHRGQGVSGAQQRGSSPRLRGTPRSVRGYAGRRGIIPALAGNTTQTAHQCRSAGDHPRACGEHVAPQTVNAPYAGSSPRLRGTRPFYSANPGTIGIIPALAGNTAHIRRHDGVSWDHPRACGEHAWSRRQCPRKQGSSPRLRGTQVHERGNRSHAGIIPALAGNTRLFASPSVWNGDHPRACGEHFRSFMKSFPDSGSSPRLRGTLALCLELVAMLGIIPALAGNTDVRVAQCHGCWDHPRACGEHSPGMPAMSPIWGSSPRLRGTLRVPYRPRLAHGIIPALAGNTGIVMVELIAPGDHPRACGEHLIASINSSGVVGSSPRLRGTLRIRERGAIPMGIIPALAGNTASWTRLSCPQRDHPRACGEHDFDKAAQQLEAGSSPRLRGKPMGQILDGHVRGIIPALAGNTLLMELALNRFRDHPRACGEHCRHGHAPPVLEGIIPALAGNTPLPARRLRRRRDHPRACGEHMSSGR